MDELKVSSKSNPNAVAGALAALIREKGCAELQAVGAGAVNQTVKAVAIARGFLESSGIQITMVPAFFDIEINGEKRTSIKFEVSVK
jgi:stage V sporulation protein S